MQNISNREERSEAYDVVKDMLSGSGGTEIEFIVESTERDGRDKVEGTCVIDLQQPPGWYDQSTHQPKIRVPDVGEVEIAIADCLCRVMDRTRDFEACALAAIMIVMNTDQVVTDIDGVKEEDTS